MNDYFKGSKTPEVQFAANAATPPQPTAGFAPPRHVDSDAFVKAQVRRHEHVLVETRTTPEAAPSERPYEPTKPEHVASGRSSPLAPPTVAAAPAVEQKALISEFDRLVQPQPVGNNTVGPRSTGVQALRQTFAEQIASEAPAYPDAQSPPSNEGLQQQLEELQWLQQQHQKLQDLQRELHHQQEEEQRHLHQLMEVQHEEAPDALAAVRQPNPTVPEMRALEPPLASHHAAPNEHPGKENQQPPGPAEKKASTSSASKEQTEAFIERCRKWQAKKEQECQRRQQKVKAQEVADCSFRPNINTRHQRKQKLSATERLYMMGKDRMKEREETRQQYENWKVLCTALHCAVLRANRQPKIYALFVSTISWCRGLASPVLPVLSACLPACLPAPLPLTCAI